MSSPRRFRAASWGGETAGTTAGAEAGVSGASGSSAGSVSRPSGTEPKIKVYILTKGADAAERDANVAKYSQWVETLKK